MSRTIRLGGVLTAVVLCLGSVSASATVTPSGATSGTHTSVTPFIVNGGAIPLSKVPFQAAILDTRNTNDRNDAFECGGSVLTSTLVITAGHCTYRDLRNGVKEDAANLKVVVNTDKLATGGTVVSVAAIHRHPSYDPVHSDRNDLALLTLSTPVSTTPVDVVPAQSDYRYVSGATGFISGWGCLSAGSDCTSPTDYPNQLRGASVPVHPNSYCQPRYAQYNVDFDPATMLCAANPSTTNAAPGPCFGDSGGPLTVAGFQGKRQLIGLVSWGIVCGGETVAFTRVATFRSWLESFGVPIAAPPLANGVTRTMLANAEPIVGDFNGDGIADVLQYRPGTLSDALYRHLVTGSSSLPVTISGTYHDAVCDVNGDGKDDIILVAPGIARDYVLFGTNDTSNFTSKVLFAINSNYEPIAGDFNGDGKCDLILYQAGPGPDHEYIGVGDGTFTDGPAINVNGAYKPIVGDYNGDGRDDVLWYAPGAGTDYLRLGKLNGTFANGAAISIHGAYTPIAGDFNSDHRTDVLWYGPGGAIDSLWYAGGTSFTQGPDVTVGGTYTPAAGDLNGDGADDIAWVSPSGTTSLWVGH